MKTELKIPESKPELKFPLLAISKRNGQTVFFTSENAGCVLISGDSHFKTGYSSNDWASVFDGHYWTILPHGTQLILTVE